MPIGTDRFWESAREREPEWRPRGDVTPSMEDCMRAILWDYIRTAQPVRDLPNFDIKVGP